MRRSPLARLAVMAALLIGLMIPLTMTLSVVSERATRRGEAAQEVGATWGGPQTIGGPVLVVPYRHVTRDREGRVYEDARRLFILPEALDVDAVITPSIRDRGLFPVLVYDAHLKVRGRFAASDFVYVPGPDDEVQWDRATISVGVSDPKGIASNVSLLWDGRRQAFGPGVSDVGLFAAGVQASAPGLSSSRSVPAPFEFELRLRGTSELRFLPVGNETNVKVTSPWPHPSFVGSPLPHGRTIDASGFTAYWQMPYFGRGFAPRWLSVTANNEKLQAQAAASAFGVALFQPVDIYQQAERAVKYAALFIVMTFVIAFLWEVSRRTLVHPVQYLFVGFALCIFYLLLVSLAEHIGFDRGYVVAAGATVTLISWYWSHVLAGARHGAVMALTLSVLYGYLYLLLRLEDFALLAGSVGLFLMLAIVMFATRRVNWYDLRLEASQMER